MNDIAFSNPLEFTMDVVDSEDNIPSIKVRIKCIIGRFSTKYMYQADAVWFDCSVWDEFIARLLLVKNNQNLHASLVDMSEDFVLIIGPVEEKIQIEIRCSVGGSLDETCNLHYKSVIDIDSLEAIAESFVAFPKWW